MKKNVAISAYCHIYTSIYASTMHKFSNLELFTHRRIENRFSRTQFRMEY